MPTMSNKPQNTPMSPPPAASPSIEPQSHQDAIVMEEDGEMLRTAVDDLYLNLVGLIDVIGGSKVEVRKDDSSEPPPPLASRISDCSTMIQKQKENIDLSLEIDTQEALEFTKKIKMIPWELQQLVTCLNEARTGSGGLLAILKNVINLLKRMSIRQSCFCQIVSQLEAEDRARKKEQEDLLEELRKIEQRFKKGMAGILTVEGSKLPLIISSIHQYIDEMQKEKSSLAADLLLLEEEKKKIDEAHRSTIKESEKAKQGARKAEEQSEKRKEDLKQAKLELENELRKCKEDLDQAKFEASTAMNMKSSLTEEFSLLAEEKKKCKEALRSTKTELEQVKQEARKAEEEFEKCKEDLQQEKLKVEEEFEKSREDLQQEKLKVKKELEKCKADLEQAKLEAEKELDKRSADLKDAKLKAERLAAVEEVISFIEFPKEIHPEETLDRVRWLAFDYKRTCEELGDMKLNLKQAKGELDKRSTALKAAELEVERLVRNTEKASEYETNEKSTGTETAPTELGEIISMESHNFWWLFGEYKRTCEELHQTKLNLEQEKHKLDERTADFKAAELIMESEYLGKMEGNIPDPSQKSVYELFNKILEREANKEVSDAGTCCTECTCPFRRKKIGLSSQFQAPRADAVHSVSSRRYPTYNSEAQLQAPESASALQTFHHGSTSAYPQPNTQWRVNWMSYDSPVQQFGGVNYDAGELLGMHTEDGRNVHTDGDQMMQPDNRSEFSRGRLDEQGSGSRLHGWGTGR